MTRPTAIVTACTPADVVQPPPKRFSAAAKEAWASVPETVRAEVLRLEAELTAGLKMHQAAAERDADLAGFHARAAKGGIALKDSLSAYVNLEDLLRSDPDKGLEVIFQNIGISSREWAMKLVGQTPDVDATTQEVLEFAAAHPRFEELADDICFFIESGRADDLAEAYSLAERFGAVLIRGIIYLTSTIFDSIKGVKELALCPFCPHRTFITKPQPTLGWRLSFGLMDRSARNAVALTALPR
jgi:hypothetical protein